jgi:hypothetical protein
MAILPAVSSSAMHGAVVPIASAIANGTTNAFVFSNIPQNYQDLVCIFYTRSAQATSSVQNYIFLNSDFANNYSGTILDGNGSTATSGRTSTIIASPVGWTSGASATSGIFGSQTTHLLNYSNTSTFKTYLSRSAADLNGSGYTRLAVNLYRSTNAITTLQISNDGNNNYVAGSTFALYGIRTVNQ